MSRSAHFPTARGRAEIEGLGAYGAKTDIAAGAEAPIIELRTPPRMPLADFLTWAPKLFDYVRELNRGGTQKFGEAELHR